MDWQERLSERAQVVRDQANVSKDADTRMELFQDSIELSPDNVYEQSRLTVFFEWLLGRVTGQEVTE